MTNAEDGSYTRHSRLPAKRKPERMQTLAEVYVTVPRSALARLAGAAAAIATRRRTLTQIAS